MIGRVAPQNHGAVLGLERFKRAARAGGKRFEKADCFPLRGPPAGPGLKEYKYSYTIEREERRSGGVPGGAEPVEERAAYGVDRAGKGRGASGAVRGRRA